MKKGIVVYDSFTGNTEKIARKISKEADFDIFKVDKAPLQLAKYKILVLGSLNIRGAPTPKIKEFMQKAKLPKYFALFLTFGLPIWGQIIAIKCFSLMRKELTQKKSECVGKFQCPGLHPKFKTYKGRPSDKDLEKAGKFAKSILAKISEKNA